MTQPAEKDEVLSKLQAEFDSLVGRLAAATRSQYKIDEEISAIHRGMDSLEAQAKARQEEKAAAKASEEVPQTAPDIAQEAPSALPEEK